MKSLAWPHNFKFLDVAGLVPAQRAPGLYHSHTTLWEALVSYGYRRMPVLSASATGPLVSPSLTFTPPPSLSAPAWMERHCGSQTAQPKTVLPRTLRQFSFSSTQPVQSYLKHRETLFTCGDTLKCKKEGREE